MTAIDLTEAVEAAARAEWERRQERSPLPWLGITDFAWDDLPHFVQCQFRVDMRPIVAAAAPAIKAAILAELDR